MNIRAKRDSTTLIDAIAIFAFEETNDGGIRPVEKLMLAGEQTPAVAFDPMITLTEKEATQLMDDLWRAGVRPSEAQAPMTNIDGVLLQRAHIDNLMEIIRCILPSRKTP